MEILTHDKEQEIGGGYSGFPSQWPFWYWIEKQIIIFIAASFIEIHSKGKDF